MSCDQIREHLEAYALGAIDSDELALVEGHLQECASCRRLAIEYLEMAHLLPLALASASRVQVPRSLKDRLLQAIQESASESSVAAQPKLRRPGLVLNLGRLVSLPQPTFIVVVIILMTILSLILNATLTVALAKERSLRAEFANLVDQQELVLEVIDSNQTTRAILRAVESDSRSYGKLYTRSDMDHVVVMAARLPQPPAGEAYHLWLTEQGKTYLAGVLKLNDQGFGMLVFDANRIGPSYESALLILQPIQSTSPAGIPVLQWKATPK